MSQKKPRRIAGVEVACQPSSEGEPTYVLHSPVANTYLKLDARDYYLCEQMDGEHSVRDLAVAYFTQYGSFPFERLVRLLGQLKANRLLEEKPLDVFGSATTHLAARTIAYRLQRFAETATQKEFSLNNVDGFFDALYRRVGWILFTRPAKIFCLVLTPIGLALFAWLVLTERYPLLSSGGSYGLGLVVLTLSNCVMIFIHECGHALAIKFYGRRVPKGGMLFYFGSLVFFVDATDAWMVPTRARIVISFAGPFSTILVGSLLSIVIAIIPSSPINPILFQAAFMGIFGSLMNLLPLLECDGYFILMDWIEIPRLRQKSLAFLKQVLGKLFAHHRFNREEKILTVFGLVTATSTGFYIASAIYLWQSQVTAMLGELASGNDPVSAILAGALAIIVGAPLVLGLGIRAILLVGAMIERAQRIRWNPGGGI